MVVELTFEYIQYEGPDAVLRIEIRYGLDGRGIESRRGQDIPHSSRKTLQPTQHPVECAPGLLPGREKLPGHSDYHPPPSSAEVKERVELYLYSLSGPS